MNEENRPLLPVPVPAPSPSYRLHVNCSRRFCVRSKPAVLILVWNFAIVACSLDDNGTILQLSGSYSAPIVVNAAFSIAVFIAPLAGLLADVKLGRYKALLCSSYAILAEIIIVTLILTVVITAIATNCCALSPVVKQVLVDILLIFCIGMVISFLVFLTNGIQFGMDQLHDSSTQDLILFIQWFIWIKYTCSVLKTLALNLIFHDSTHLSYLDWPRYIGFSLQIAILVTAAVMLVFSLCALHHKNRWFLIQPAKLNPYKLVFQVLQFASQHKVPVNRSAFTYTSEDGFPSRLDLGKIKYGGPFTTEKVEDVKTLFRILKVLLSLGPVFFLQFIVQSMMSVFASHGNIFKVKKNHTFTDEVHIEGVARHIFISNGLLSTTLVVICISVCICLFRSHNISYWVPGMLKRIGCGVIVLILSLLATLAMDYVVHERKTEYANCMFQSYTQKAVFINTSDVHTLPLFQNLYFFIGQNMMSALANMLIDISILEFICSQSPYSMKGFVFGSMMSIRSLFQALSFTSVIPFGLAWKVQGLSCGSGFYLMAIAIGVLALLLYTCVVRKYKYRQRDDRPNEYQYAENYYSNIHY